MPVARFLIVVFGLLLPVSAMAQSPTQPSYQTPNPGNVPGLGEKVYGAVSMWFDSTFGYPRPASTEYPMPISVQPATVTHTTLPSITLTNGVAQVVIPAGSIKNGCTITFSNSYGAFVVSYTDPGAPTTPTASTSRGLEFPVSGTYAGITPLNYKCPTGTQQGVSMLFIGYGGGGQTTPTASAPVYIDVF